GVGHGVAHVEEATKQLAQLQAARSWTWRAVVAVQAPDRLLEGLAPDEAHGVEGATVRVSAQPVDRHDTWVFKATGDLAFQQEASAALRVGEVSFLDLLESDLAVQLPVPCEEHFTESSAGVRANDLIPEPGRGGSVRHVAGRRRVRECRLGRKNVQCGL